MADQKKQKSFSIASFFGKLKSKPLRATMYRTQSDGKSLHELIDAIIADHNDKTYYIRYDKNYNPNTRQANVHIYLPISHDNHNHIYRIKNGYDINDYLFISANDAKCSKYANHFSSVYTNEVYCAMKLNELIDMLKQFQRMEVITNITFMFCEYVVIC